MKYVLSLLLLLIPLTANSAIDCADVPSCASLGFSTQDSPDCPSDGYIRCPFDISYKKCVVAQNTDCAQIGFTKDSKVDWCGTIIKCPSDKDYTLCASLDSDTKSCRIGYVYYSDNTCSDASLYDPANTAKIPVGIVFWLADEKGSSGKIVNLKDLTFNGNSFDPTNPYGQSTKKVIMGLTNVDLEAEGLKYYMAGSGELAKDLRDHSGEAYDDGYKNTQTMSEKRLAACEHNEGTKNWAGYCVSVAAKAAMDFYPDSSLLTSPDFGPKHWWIPAIGELTDLIGFNKSITGQISDQGTSGHTGDVYAAVNSALETLASKSDVAEPLSSDYYWSSTPRDNEYTWENKANGHRAAKKRSNTLLLRVITEY